MEQVHLRIDEGGRIKLPDTLLLRLGLQPSEAIVLEISRAGALIRSKAGESSLTERVASLNLPVSDWDQMKGEIEAERLG